MKKLKLIVLFTGMLVLIPMVVWFVLPKTIKVLTSIVVGLTIILNYTFLLKFLFLDSMALQVVQVWSSFDGDSFITGLVLASVLVLFTNFKGV